MPIPCSAGYAVCFTNRMATKKLHTPYWRAPTARTDQWTQPKGLGFILAIAAVLSVTLSAQAQTIYRCNTPTGLVFSDQPCDENAQAYTPTAGLSVVAPSGDLEHAQRANQAFIAAQAEDRAARRQSRSVSAPAAEPAVGQAGGPSGLNPLGLWPIETRNHTRLAPPAAPARSGDTERPFSALSGPFPGTRTRTAEESGTDQDLLSSRRGRERPP